MQLVQMSTYVVLELYPIAGPVRFVFTVLAAVGSGAVEVIAGWIEAPNVGKAGLAAGVPNDILLAAPNAGAGADVVAAGVPNDSVELVVVGVPNDKEPLGAGAAPINGHVT